MWRQRIRSFKYAFQGVSYLLRSQPNARIHLAATVMVVLLGFWLAVDRTEWCLLTLCVGLVFGAEALNTSLEELTNLVSPDHHPLAGRAKDTAAAGVLFLAGAAAVTGGIIFIPKLYHLLFL